MNVWLWDAKPSNRFEVSAGATRPRLILDASAVQDPDAPLAAQVSGRAGESAVVRLMPRDGAPSSGAVVIIARRGDAGTWHGVGRPAGDDPVARDLGPEELVAIGRSCSGGGDHVVALIRLRPEAEPIHILTSRYKGRGGWIVHTVRPDGTYEYTTLAEWRARRAAAVEL